MWEQLVICLKQFQDFDWLRALTEANPRHQIALRMFVAREHKIGASFDVLNCAELVLAKLNSRPLDRIKSFLGKQILIFSSERTFQASLAFTKCHFSLMARPFIKIKISISGSTQKAKIIIRNGKTIHYFYFFAVGCAPANWLCINQESYNLFSDCICTFQIAVFWKSLAIRERQKKIENHFSTVKRS